MKLPEDIRSQLSTRWRSRRQEWLVGSGDWPLSLPLGLPGEKIAQANPLAVRSWVGRWREALPSGVVDWTTRSWRALGEQKLPERLQLASAAEVAAWLGESTAWSRANARYHEIVRRWPKLSRVLPTYFDVLAYYSDANLNRLVALLEWLLEHSASGLYPRQLPIAGIDSKWMEERRPIVTTLLAALTEKDSGDFYDVCGLRAPTGLLRMRILDPALRSKIGDLSDISAPAADLAQLRWKVSRVFVAENLQTGLAFTDLPGSVVFMRMGYAVSALKDLPWIADTTCLYWGDLDTHGFSILNRVRHAVPHARSMLMDEATLLSHRDLWGKEPDPSTAELPLLTPSEEALYRGLQENQWGERVRLEQERLRWDEAWAAVIEAVGDT